MDWLPRTMNSVSPVMPLDARRMCSRSTRFMAAEDLHALVLGHQQCKRACMAHASGILAAVLQDGEDGFHPAGLDQAAPLCQRLLGMDGVLGVGHQLFNPCESDRQ